MARVVAPGISVQEKDGHACFGLGLVHLLKDLSTG